MSTISKPFFSLGNPNGAPYSRVKNSPRNYEGYFFYNCKWKHFILYKDSNRAKNLKISLRNDHSGLEGFGFLGRYLSVCDDDDGITY